MVSLQSYLRYSRERQPRSFCIAVTLERGEWSCFTHRAARRWIISTLLMFDLVLGLQMHEAYSNCGRTSVLYASCFTFSFLVVMFRLIKPRVLFALDVILLMWLLYDRLLDKSTMTDVPCHYTSVPMHYRAISGRSVPPIECIVNKYHIGGTERLGWWIL